MMFSKKKSVKQVEDMLYADLEKRGCTVLVPYGTSSLAS